MLSLEAHPVGCAVTIRTLADRPEAIPVLARWFYGEWRDFDGRTIANIETQLGQNLSRHSIPISFLAEAGTEIVGTVSIDVSDFPTLDQFSPWLAALYVKPSFRQQGVGTALMLHAQHFAMSLSVQRLYLWTVRPSKFYENCGWTVLRHTTYHSHPVTVMQFVPSAPPAMHTHSPSACRGRGAVIGHAPK